MTNLGQKKKNRDLRQGGQLMFYEMVIISSKCSAKKLLGNQCKRKKRTFISRSLDCGLRKYFYFHLRFDFKFNKKYF